MLLKKLAPRELSRPGSGGWYTDPLAGALGGGTMKVNVGGDDAASAPAGNSDAAAKLWESNGRLAISNVLELEAKVNEV